MGVGQICDDCTIYQRPAKVTDEVLPRNGPEGKAGITLEKPGKPGFFSFYA